MKRVDLLKKLATIAKERGEKLTITEGGNHTKVWIGHKMTPVPRHREIAEGTVRTILKSIREDNEA